MRVASTCRDPHPVMGRSGSHRLGDRGLRFEQRFGGQQRSRHPGWSFGRAGWRRSGRFNLGHRGKQPGRQQLGRQQLGRHLHARRPSQRRVVRPVRHETGDVQFGWSMGQRAVRRRGRLRSWADRQAVVRSVRDTDPLVPAGLHLEQLGLMQRRGRVRAWTYGYGGLRQLRLALAHVPEQLQLGRLGHLHRDRPVQPGSGRHRGLRQVRHLQPHVPERLHVGIIRPVRLRRRGLGRRRRTLAGERP